ncbi:MAG: ferric iron uptake transcriptional regulator [Burkholderiaceae bacterium]
MTDASDLKRLGLKATLPRLLILRVFEQSHQRHLSTEDVYRQMLHQGHDVGLATVYRVLAQLQQAGLLKHARFESGKAFYELDDGQHHDHLVCTHCGRVIEFHDDTIERRQKLAASALGFAVVEHSLTLYGRCMRADCEHLPTNRIPSLQRGQEDDFGR